MRYRSYALANAPAPRIFFTAFSPHMEEGKKCCRKPAANVTADALRRSPRMTVHCYEMRTIAHPKQPAIGASGFHFGIRIPDFVTSATSN
jgi:hypothetical protein